MKIHGDYCGPNWSAGEHQSSVVSTIPARDEFDQTCKEHDAVYANKGDTRSADLEFARRNIGRGPIRTAAGMAVGLQGLARKRGNKMLRGAYAVSAEGTAVAQKAINRAEAAQVESDAHKLKELEDLGFHVVPSYAGPGNEFQSQIEVDARGQASNNLRGNVRRDFRPTEFNRDRTKNQPSTTAVVAGSQKKTMVKGRKQNKGGNKSGNGFRGTQPTNSMMSAFSSQPVRTVRTSRHGEVMQGTVYLTSLTTYAQVDTSYDLLALQALIPLAPAHWGNSYVSNTARFYEMYRIKKLRLHYMTASSTTTSGTVVLSHQADPLNEVPNRARDAPDLYSNLFSRENTLLGPVWENLFMDIPVNEGGYSGWKYNDSKYGHTVNELISGYALAYSTLTTGTPGRLALEFEVEFKDRANEISTNNIPRSVGQSMTCTIAATASGNPANVTGSALSSAFGTAGAIVIMYVDESGSTLGTGPANWSALLTFNGQQVDVGAGDALYLRNTDAATDTWRIHISLESAIGGDTSLEIGTTTSDTTTLQIMAYSVIANPEFLN